MPDVSWTEKRRTIVSSRAFLAPLAGSKNRAQWELQAQRARRPHLALPERPLQQRTTMLAKTGRGSHQGSFTNCRLFQSANIVEVPASVTSSIAYTASSSAILRMALLSTAILTKILPGVKIDEDVPLRSEK